MREITGGIPKMAENEKRALEILLKKDTPKPEGKLLIGVNPEEVERQKRIADRKQKALERRKKYQKLGIPDIGGKPKPIHLKTGRPSKMTPEVLNKLEQAFLLGCTDQEACLLADISPNTLNLYQRANPLFYERKLQLKESPTVKARATIVADLDSPESAKWYLERKRKDEFSTKTETEATGTITLAIAKEDKDL